MTIAVTVEDKQDFIRWFLKKYKLKRRECTWILNYLLSHDHLLRNAHFTDDAHYCPKAIVMTATNTEGIPFRFYNGNLMTSDAEKAFSDLRLHPDDKMYIQLNFPNKHSCTEYANVYEENHYIPLNLQKNKEDKKLAEEFLNYMSKTLLQTALLAQIDEALDMNDKKLFMELTDKLNQIKKDAVIING